MYNYNMITKLMTKAEYARHRGFSTQYLSGLIRKKKIVPEYDGKINPEKADALLGPVKNKSTIIHLSIPKIEEPKPQVQVKSKMQEISLTEAIEISAEKILSSETLFEAQKYREIYAALIKKLEYQKAKGLLRSGEEVDKLNFDTARLIRDFLISIPDRLAPLVAAETDLHTCTQILKVEIHSLLESISDAFA